MKRYEYTFDDNETITLKGKGLKEAIKRYRTEHPKQLSTTIKWKAKSGKEMEKLVKLREVNIGIDRYGNIIRWKCNGSSLGIGLIEKRSWN